MPAIRIACVGNPHRPVIEQITYKALEPGDFLFLSPEPGNSHDSNAIKILYENESGDRLHLGYVPRSMTSALHPHLSDPFFKAFWNGDNVSVEWGDPICDVE